MRLKVDKESDALYFRREGIPPSWYSPEKFIEQKKDFQSSMAFTSISGVKYRSNCSFEEPGGYYSNESITFIGGVRVMLIMGSDKDCVQMLNAFESLLSKIKFEIHN